MTTKFGSRFAAARDGETADCANTASVRASPAAAPHQIGERVFIGPAFLAVDHPGSEDQGGARRPPTISRCARGPRQPVRAATHAANPMQCVFRAVALYVRTISHGLEIPPVG